MFLDKLNFGSVELTEDLLESITRWDHIQAPHKAIEVDGKKQRNWGEPIFDDIFMKSPFTVTEKIDGTNVAWVIFLAFGLPQIYLIRSRKEFLMFSEDLLGQDKFYALSTLLPNGQLMMDLATALSDKSMDEILCFYGELYGKGIQKGGKYSNKINWRLFGAKRLTPPFVKQFSKIPREEHYQHRWDHMIDQDEVHLHAAQIGVPYAPILDRKQGSFFATPEEVRRYLGSLRSISEVASQDGGTPTNSLEGVVIRCEYPFQIYKLKYGSYVL